MWRERESSRFIENPGILHGLCLTQDSNFNVIANYEQAPRPRIGRWGFQSYVVDRGCASSLQVTCEQLDSMPTGTSAAIADLGNHNQHHQQHVVSRPADDGLGRIDPNGISAGGSSQKLLCCSTDLCNGLEDARSEGQLRSEEHRRTLMEGSSWHRRSSWASYFSGGSSLSGGDGHGMGTTGVEDERFADGGEDNSAKLTRGANVGGSRFATVLVIVGTFSQVLWLVSSLVN